MSEQEPKPPNPNELLSPPPVVNPPSSRTDKNLKTKKTTRTMNPKPTNTMKHRKILSKSTDVNFKKVMTRSSSKGSELGLGVDDMECGEAAGISSFGKEGSGSVVDDVMGKSGGVVDNVTGEENDAGKCMEKKEGVFANDSNDNVSAMFPELNSANVSQGSIDNLVEMPVPFDQNPILNPSCTKNSSKSSKPLLFSNVVHGAKYIGGNKLSRIASRIGTPLIMDKVTTAMCEKGSGRANYARVLVEVDAAKGLVDSVEIWYRKLNRSMCLKVEYAWQPPICSHCCVFGHSLEKCTNRVSSDKEKIVKNDTYGQNNNRENDVQKNEDGWQYVDYGKTNRNHGVQRNNGEAGMSQTQSFNSYGTGSSRGGGMYIRRGGPGFRGRGGYNGRGGYTSYQVNTDKKNVQMKSSDKGKEVVVEGIKNQEKNKEMNNGKEDKVKFIAQRNFTSKNRFDALAKGEGDDSGNEWQGVKVNIDVACEMGIPFDEDEVVKWPNDLQAYYKEKCAKMKERNMRLFGSYGRTEDELFKVIVDSVRFRIMGLKINVTTDVMAAAEIWCFPIDKNIKYSLVWFCSDWDFDASTGMWECNRIFLKGVWIMDGIGRRLSKGANDWKSRILIMWKTGWWCSDPVFALRGNSNYFIFVSCYAGCLPLVICSRLAEFDAKGLWNTCCSFISHDLERSYSFSLFKVLPYGFYLTRFFKEKTFLLAAACVCYTGDDNYQTYELFDILDCFVMVGL
ncbi:zinc knuckle CX2CX4HX4C [Artemisia annua]|uniref:Zinc knuckle CX2CX4HX4C n=1 Tax=Artemisia annua TaxID=35608 RepID=A0A2U1P7S8_ARTAN|nr:zinc knuckle CX2CX4HX4C [Artemisia annua]